jgi:hypothetical protein
MIYGRNRVPNIDPSSKNKVHIYDGTFDSPGKPLCPHGWNRGDHYSILREGEVDTSSTKPTDVCNICWRKAKGANQ